MTARHPRGSGAGGQFAARERPEAGISLDFTPITNEDDSLLPFCDECGEQSDQLRQTTDAMSMCPYCYDDLAAAYED